jgi:hypothetical protein
VWGTNSAPTGGTALYFPISFTLPLSSAPEPIVVPATQESAPGCPGRGGGELEDEYVPGIPMAEQGKLCVYMTLAGPGATVTIEKYEYEGIFEEFELVPGAMSTGAVAKATCSVSTCSAAGTWAVTAE